MDKPSKGPGVATQIGQAVGYMRKCTAGQYEARRFEALRAVDRVIRQHPEGTALATVARKYARVYAHARHRNPHTGPKRRRQRDCALGARQTLYEALNDDWRYVG